MTVMNVEVGIELIPVPLLAVIDIEVDIEFMLVPLLAVIEEFRLSVILAVIDIEELRLSVIPAVIDIEEFIPSVVTIIELLEAAARFSSANSGEKLTLL